MDGRVEFRLLQVIFSHVGDERLTLLLLHWGDGVLRVATGFPKHMPRPSLPVGQLKRMVKNIAREALRSPKPASGLLAELYRVREGFGSNFPYWSHVRVGQTSNVAAHFEELRKHFGMKRIELPKRKPRKKAAAV
jgi:hypothetical protein